MRPLTVFVLLAVGTLAACSANVDYRDPEDLVSKNPIVDIRTPFDEALECLSPHINRGITFAVGNINDHTGRESYSDGGTGKFVSQGASEMVQSALFRSGATLVNRRDIAIPIEEGRWGIRDLKTQRPALQYISGSINGLDFIPGGGFSALFNGVGPRYRRSQILISLDLYMTDAATGTIVANVPLQKQLSASEFGGAAGRFFGSTLVNIDVGAQNREALNFALRQMLSLATFELLAQRMNPKNYLPCRAKIDEMLGEISDVGTGETARVVYAELEKLRASDPEAAQILERELAGEKIEDIMKDLGRPVPKPTRATPSSKNVPVAASTMKNPDSAAVTTEKDGESGEDLARAAEANANSHFEAKDQNAVLSGNTSISQHSDLVNDEMQARQNSSEKESSPASLSILFDEMLEKTRLTVFADEAIPIRWGFREGKLVIVALNAQPFSIADEGASTAPERVTSVGKRTSGKLQVLTLDLSCECGAEGGRDEEGNLVIYIDERAERPNLELSDVQKPRAGIQLAGLEVNSEMPSRK